MTTDAAHAPEARWRQFFDMRLLTFAAALLAVCLLDRPGSPMLAFWYALPERADHLIVTHTAHAITVTGALLLVTAVCVARSLHARSMADAVCFIICAPLMLAFAAVTVSRASLWLEATPDHAHVRLHLLYQREVPREDAVRLVAKHYRLPRTVGHVPLLERRDGSRVHLQEWHFAAELARSWQLPMDEESRAIVRRHLGEPTHENAASR